MTSQSLPEDRRTSLSPNTPEMHTLVADQVGALISRSIVDAIASTEAASSVQTLAEVERLYHEETAAAWESACSASATTPRSTTLLDSKSAIPFTPETDPTATMAASVPNTQLRQRQLLYDGAEESEGLDGYSPYRPTPTAVDAGAQACPAIAATITATATLMSEADAEARVPKARLRLPLAPTDKVRPREEEMPPEQATRPEEAMQTAEAMLLAEARPPEVEVGSPDSAPQQVSAERHPATPPSADAPFGDAAGVAPSAYLDEVQPQRSSPSRERRLRRSNTSGILAEWPAAAAPSDATWQAMERHLATDAALLLASPGLAPTVAALGSSSNSNPSTPSSSLMPKPRNLLRAVRRGCAAPSLPDTRASTPRRPHACRDRLHRTSPRPLWPL